MKARPWLRYGVPVFILAAVAAIVWLAPEEKTLGPGIKSVYKETWSRFPVRLSVSIMGRSIGSDATLLGVEVEAIEEENRDSFLDRLLAASR